MVTRLQSFWQTFSKIKWGGTLADSFESQVELTMQNDLTPRLRLETFEIFTQKYRKKKIFNERLLKSGLYLDLEKLDPHINVIANGFQDRFFLKFFPVASFCRVQRLLSVHRLLQINKIEVPSIVYSHVVDRPSLANECSVVAMEWIEGSTLLDCDEDTKCAAFRNLAKIHQILPDSLSSINIDNHKTIPVRSTTRREHCVSVDSDSIIRQVCKGFSSRDIDKVQVFLDKGLAKMADASPETCLTLSGFNPRNVLVSRSNSLFIIDFENAAFSEFSYDLCDALIKFNFGRSVSKKIDSLSFDDLLSLFYRSTYLETYFSENPSWKSFWDDYFAIIISIAYYRSIRVLALRAYNSSVYSKKKRKIYSEQASYRLNQLIQFVK